MRAIIICGGEAGDINRVRSRINDEDMIICADSGYKYAKQMGISPDVVIGDFDSFEKAAIECENIKIYPVKKDFTDGEMAAEYACLNGADEILLLCALGGRIDHELVNIYLLKHLHKKGVRASIYDGRCEIYFCDNEIFLEGKKGDLLSVIPFSEAKKLTTYGLEYRLCNEDLPQTGLSNVFESAGAGIKIGSGEAIVVYTKKEYA